MSNIGCSSYCAGVPCSPRRRSSSCCWRPRNCLAFLWFGADRLAFLSRRLVWLGPVALAGDHRLACPDDRFRSREALRQLEGPAEQSGHQRRGLSDDRADLRIAALLADPDRQARLFGRLDGAVVGLAERHGLVAGVPGADRTGWFSPDGELIHARLKSGEVRSWRLGRGRETATPAGPVAMGPVATPPFPEAESGAMTISAGATILEFKREANKIKVLAGPGDKERMLTGASGVVCVALSNDGLLALSASKNGVVRMWDLQGTRRRANRAAIPSACTWIRRMPSPVRETRSSSFRPGETRRTTRWPSGA